MGHRISLFSFVPSTLNRTNSLLFPQILPLLAGASVVSAGRWEVIHLHSEDIEGRCMLGELILPTPIECPQRKVMGWSSVAN